MDLLRELTENDNTIEAIPLVEAIEESVRSLQLQQKGGKINPTLKGAKDFFKSNPGLVSGAAALALSAYGEYQKNKRGTIRLHAKTAYEKRMMTSIIDALTKDGKFKVQRIKFEGGGKTWVLRRKWA
jgi:hypothetical protein